ncbi:hypothetical protein AGMMS49531_01630 [Endomicrobiia bacterium]|nr:hypothetical protein AGMMS49531_01630 [Endomicrobiia bacterium]
MINVHIHTVDESVILVGVGYFTNDSTEFISGRFRQFETIDQSYRFSEEVDVEAIVVLKVYI